MLARRQKLIDAGTELLQSTPQEFSDHCRKEAAKWAEAVKKAGIRLMPQNRGPR